MIQENEQIIPKKPGQPDKSDKHSDLYQGRKKRMSEDAPVNAVGGGQIAGVGVGPQGEPGIKKKKNIASFVSFIKRKAPV